MPREHTPAVTQEGTLKSKVRTSQMVYQSDLCSQVVHPYVTQGDPGNQSIDTALSGYRTLIFRTTH